MLKELLFHKYTQLTLRILVGGIFLYASLNKLFAPEEFAKAIYNYDILPLVTINILAITLPYIEFISGGLLVIGRFIKGSSAVISISLIIFILALFSALARGLDINCGCFSLDISASKGDIILRIIEDMLLLIGALLIFVFPENKNKQNNLNI